MNNMEDCKDGGPVTRSEAANPHDSNGTQDNKAGDNPRPMLSLVSESPGHSSHVEEGFFEKGTAEDKAAMEMYAAMLPRGFNLGRINPRYLMIAGAAVLLLVGVAAGRHLPGGHSSGTVVAPPAEASPAQAAPAPAPAAPALAAPAATAEAPAPVPAVPAPAPTIPPAQLAAAEPGAAEPTPPAPAEPVANKETPAPAPAVATAPAEQTAQPEAPAAPAPAVAAPEPEPKALAAAETAPSEASAGAPAETPNVQSCREAIKKRDIKAVGASCESALAADASLAKPLLSFAKAQFEKGKSAQAAVWARRIVQVNGSLADAYLIMGAAEQEAHHAAAAKTAYQRYLELAPKGPYADDVRSSLRSL